MSKYVPDDQVKKKQLKKWLKEHLGATERTKNDIEREELGDPKSHGKRITRLWRERLGVETEAVHPLVTAVRELRQQVIDLGEEPVA